MAHTDPQSDESPGQEDLRSGGPEEAEQPEDADKRLEDLDPEEEEAAGVHGGKRIRGRYGRRL